MKPLTGYGQMAERHWRQHLPKMVAALEAKGRLHEILLEIEDVTDLEMSQLRLKFVRRGFTEEQALQRAWEICRERYIFLTPEFE